MLPVTLAGTPPFAAAYIGLSTRTALPLRAASVTAVFTAAAGPFVTDKVKGSPRERDAWSTENVQPDLSCARPAGAANNAASTSIEPKAARGIVAGRLPVRFT
jgi:hypothetical protein